MNQSIIINADARHIPLADRSVQCVVTSPPYYGLRSYLPNGHELKSLEIGLEQTPAEYVAQMVQVFNEVWRVLRDDGVLWLNIGDSYCGYKGDKYQVDTTTSNLQKERRTPKSHVIGTPQTSGAKPKDLLGIPWRVAFALQDAGWYLRSDIIWAKPNPMPESVTDRPTKAHEYVFLLTKSARYFYDAEAVAEPAQYFGKDARSGAGNIRYEGKRTVDTSGANGQQSFVTINETRNLRSVWTIATQPYSGAHFATMPPELARRCIKAGSKAGDLILDPFSGSGTTGKVALELDRLYAGLELNPASIELHAERQTVTLGMGW